MGDIFFLKGDQDVLKHEDQNTDIEQIKNELAKVFDTKSLSFLLGSGCSSLKDDGKEVGIPTMKFLAKDFYSNRSNQYCLSDKDTKFIKEDLCIDIDDDGYKNNLERFLETLLSLEFYVSKADIPVRITGAYNKLDKQLKKMKSLLPPLLDKVRLFVLQKCLNESNKDKDQALIDLYESFYRKLLYRNPNLAKPNIFTTNYDLYSEIALDNIGIHYANGFSGGINKYFNPTILNYAFAERLDLSQNKWNVIDNFIYLYKMHGSVNWIEDDSDANKLFKIKEIQNPSFESLKNRKSIMIYPTPTKQNASLGSPYSDLFREFQKKLMQNNNVLITMGYSFSDEHINNLIYQAFTIPSFRLIVFLDKETEGAQKLRGLNDPRIWIIGGKLEDGDRLHYFNKIVGMLLPDLNNDEIDKKIEAVIRNLFNTKS